MNISPLSPAPVNYPGSPSTEPSTQIKFKRPDSREHTPSSRHAPESILGHKNYVNNEVLFQDAQVKISQDFEFSAGKDGEVNIVFMEFVLETGNHADKVKITNAADGKLLATVNGKAYTLELLNRPEQGMVQPLHIKTHGGNDSVVVDPDVITPIRINLGAGNDYARAGGGHTQIKGGAGDDFIFLGHGNGVASGEDGNDVLVAGTGSGALYGGNGNDRIQALEGPSNRVMHMDGGNGNDFLIAKHGHTVMHGGRGDNLMVNLGSAVIYTGRGNNSVSSYHDDTVIYAKPSDKVTRTLNSRRFDVLPSDDGKTGYRVEGTPEFKQRVEDDLELLRMSPTGQQGLKKADELARKNNAPITINELSTRYDMLYSFNSNTIHQNFQSGGDIESLTPSELGYITDGKPGARADLGEINYNPSYVYNARTTPVIGLYHEMAHAFNGATGTFLPGGTAGEPDIERQAIGLPTDTEPFDFDDDPATAPTTTNPLQFSENGLRQEMRLPLRNSVYEPGQS